MIAPVPPSSQLFPPDSAEQAAAAENSSLPNQSGAFLTAECEGYFGDVAIDKGSASDPAAAAPTSLDLAGILLGDDDADASFADEDLIPARMLNEFTYCPRLAYLEWVQGEFTDNLDTRQGTFGHRNVDKPSARKVPAGDQSHEAGDLDDDESAGPIKTRSLTLSAPHEGLVAKLDVLELEGNLATPVEYKKGAIPDNPHQAWEPERVQLCAQGLILRENGYSCEQGELYYIESRHRVVVPFDDALVMRTRELVKRLREVAGAGQMPPPLVDSPKCPRCSLVGICLPDETNFLIRQANEAADKSRFAQSQTTLFANETSILNPSPNSGNPATPGPGREFGIASNRYRANDSPILNPSSDAHEPAVPAREPAVPEAVSGELEFGIAANRYRANDSPILNPSSDAHEPAVPGGVPGVRRLLPARDDALPLYVKEQGAFIGKDGDRLVVRHREAKLLSLPLIEVSQVSLFGNVQMSAQALREVVDRGIPVCHFSYGGWFQAMTTGHVHKNIELRIAQFATAADPARSLALAKGFITAKIKNSRTMLRRHASEKHQRDLEQLAEWVQTAERATSAESLLGIEGMAAKVYFSGFTRILKGGQAFEMNGRNRRPPRDPVNAILSFVYSLLAKELTIAVRAVGFDPLLGFFHKPHYGRPSLALDLAEEFRPIIADSTAMMLINNGEVSESSFLARAGAVALTEPGRKAVIAAFERRMEQEITHPVFGYKISYRRVLEVQARLLSRVVLGELAEYPGFCTR